MLNELILLVKCKDDKFSISNGPHAKIFYECTDVFMIIRKVLATFIFKTDCSCFGVFYELIVCPYLFLNIAVFQQMKIHHAHWANLLIHMRIKMQALDALCWHWKNLYHVCDPINSQWPIFKSVAINLNRW